MTALAWLPWAVYLAGEGFRTGAASRAAACGLCLAAQVLAGSPDVLALTVLAIAVEAAATMEWRPAAAAVRARQIALAALVGATLSAAQWLPSLEAALRAGRAQLPWAVRAYWSTHPWHLLQALYPVPLSDLPLSGPVRALLFEGRDPYLHSLYLGLGALVLAAHGFVSASPRQRACAAVLAGAGVTLALGRHLPVYGLITGLVPPAQLLRYPMKAFLLTAFAIARLVGHGVDGTRRSRSAWIAAPVALAWAGLLVIRQRPQAASPWLTPAPGDPALSVLLAPTFAALASCALAATGVWILAAYRPRRWALVAGLLAVADLALVNRSVNPSAPRGLFDRPPPTLALFPESGSPRLFSWDYSVMPFPPEAAAAAVRLPVGPLNLAWAMASHVDLLPPTGSRWGIRGSFDVDVVRLSPTPLERLVSAFRGASPEERLRLLQLGGVDFVLCLHREGLEGLSAVGLSPSLHGVPLLAFRVPGRLPRTYAVGAARSASDDDALRLLLDPSFDFRREVVVPDEGVRDKRPFHGSSRIIEARADRLRIEADLDRPGLIVLLDTHDPGWQARVDGRPERVRRANVAFMAVSVPGGRHTVELAYRPRSVYWGLALSVFGVCAIGVVSWRWNKAIR